MTPNEFYSYSINEDTDGFTITVSDLNGNGTDVCLCKSKKIADFVLNEFDNMAIDEERDLFELGDES